MELREVLTRAAQLWLDQQSKRKRGEKFTLSDREIKEFLDAARDRDDQVWFEIETLLKSLSPLYPLRTVRLRRELKWLRKQASKKGLSWGRK